MRQVVEVTRRGRRGSDGASGIVSVLRTDESITLATQNRGFAIVTEASVTITLPAASAIGTGWSCTVYALSGTATLSSTSDINGSASDTVIPEGYSVQILTDGAEYLLQYFIASGVATVNSNAVGNESDVPGAAVTDALDALLGLLTGWGMTANAPLLANLDATGTAAGLYRFDADTTGTLPADWTTDDVGTIVIWRETSTSAVMLGVSRDDGYLWKRTMVSSVWGAWSRLDVRAQDQATWNAATGTVEGSITPAKLAAAIDNKRRVYQVSQTATSGTNGPNSSAATWNARALDRVDVASDGMSLATGVVTARAGVYDVTAMAAAFAVGNHRIRLYDVTNSAVLLDGLAANAPGANWQTAALLMGRITLAAETVLRLEHYTQSAATAGLGIPASTGATETYAQLRLEWLSAT